MLRITLPVAKRALARASGHDRRPQMNAPERMKLPVLPLKETVVFPESMTPLAVGQERSVKLIDDVVSGERMLALITVQNPEADPPGWDDLYRVGTLAVVHKMIKVPDGTLRILVQGLQRVRLVEPEQEEPYLTAELEELPDVRSGLAGGGGAHPQRPGPVHAHHRDDAVPARGAAARGRERRRPERALPPDRLDAPPQDRRAAGAARDGQRRGAPARGLADPEPRGRDVGARLEDPVPGRERDRQGPAGVLPPPAAEGDPGRARRGRRAAGGDQRAARPDRGEEPARARAQGSHPRARPAREAAARGRRVRRHPHVPRLDHLAALDRADQGRPRPRPRPPDPRRGPLRSREGEGADHRVPRRLEAEERPLRPDPLLRRPAGRRQDLARTLDRAFRRPAASRGSPSAASGTSRRSAGTAARTSARCPARSSARSATPSRATPSS